MLYDYIQIRYIYKMYFENGLLKNNYLKKHKLTGKSSARQPNFNQMPEGNEIQIM